MGDIYFVYLDYETKRIHLEISNESSDEPYVRGDFSPSELRNVLLMIEQGLDQELRMCEQFDMIVADIQLEEQP